MQVYRQSRNYENLNKRIYPGAGVYRIPELKAAEFDVDHWISFNFAKSCEEPEKHGIHFFVDDYQFMRLWKNPDAYTEMLRKFQAVCTPDFSTYVDFPLAIQIYNHYRPGCGSAAGRSRKKGGERRNGKQAKVYKPRRNAGQDRPVF